MGRFDGDLWAGKVAGNFGVFIDDRANDAQAKALPTIFGGSAGGFPGQVNALFTGGRKIIGIERAKIPFEITPNQSRWGVDIAGKVKAWAEALVGPTSNPGEYPRLANAPGSETGPGPQLVTWVNRLFAPSMRLALISHGPSIPPSTFLLIGLGHS